MSVCSGSGIRWVSFLESTESKRHNSTLVPASEKIAKLTPAPSNVAPSGYGLPGQTLMRFPPPVQNPSRLWAVLPSTHENGPPHRGQRPVPDSRGGANAVPTSAGRELREAGDRAGRFRRA